MAGARQQIGQDALVSILRKLETMVEDTNQSYEQSLVLLSSTEAIMKNEVSVELKKQTAILMAIESKLSKAAEDQQQFKGKEFNDAELTTMSKSLGDLAKAAGKINDKMGDRVKDFLLKISEGIGKFTENIDADKAKATADLIGAIGSGVIKYAVGLAIATPFLILAIPGVILFGLTLRLLTKTAGEVNPENFKAMANVLDLAKGALLFGLAMVAYTVLAPVAIIGATLFGLSIRLLMKSAGIVDESNAKSMGAVLMMAKGALLFGLAMATYTILAPIAIIGSVLFGLSIRLLMKSASVVDKESAVAMGNVLLLARGTLLFGLAMALYTVIAPIAIIGAVLFGLSIRLLFATMGQMDIKKIMAMQSILSLAKGVLLFGLSMAIYTILAPIAMIGTVLFGLTIRLLFATIGQMDNKKIQAMQSILSLAKGILLFAIAMVVVTALFPIVLIGAVMFSISMFIISFGLRQISNKNARKGIFNLLLLSLSIIIFGLTLMAFNASVKPMEAIFVALTVATFGLIFYLLGKGFNEILKGAFAVAAIGLGVAILGLGLLVYSQANLSWEEIAQLGVVIVGLGLSFYVAGKFAIDIALGSAAMIVASAAILVLSTALLIYSQANLTWESVAILGAVIIGLGTAMGVAGLAAPFIAAGSAAMIVASAAVLVLSTALLIYSQANLTFEDAAILGLVVVGLGTAMGVAGLASPFILAGAAAMIVAGVALLPIALGLAAFKAINFTKEDGQNLTVALGSVVSGFLGGEIPGGLIAGLKFAAQAAARAALLLISIPPMILAGGALMLIVPALSTFKKAGFNKSDADNIEYMIGSVVRAFGIVTDTDRQKAMGFNVNPVDLFFGIESLSGAGRVLAGLADGIKAWANMEVNEWEVVNPGTKDAKLVIKGRRKLTKTDFENAAFGIASVITAIAAPFALVGRLEKGESSGNPLYDSIFGGGFVSSGISALKRSGDTIISLAEGVKAFATMEYTQFEVIGAGTKNAKLVPKGIFKLGSTEIDAAAKNIGTVIGIVAAAFAKVGRDEKNSEGVFSGGFVSKGVEAMAGVGDNLGAIVDSVLKMANREIPTFDLINAGTKDAKLVPGKPRVISDTDLINASTNIAEILQIVARGFYNIGKAESDSSSFWGDGFITKGVASLAGIGETVSKVTDAVFKIATGEIPQMKEVDGKLVQGASIKVTDAMLKSAAKTINDITMIIGQGMYDFGVYYEKNKSSIDVATKAIPTISEAISLLVDPFMEYSKIESDKVINARFNLSHWMGAIGESINSMILNLGGFAINIGLLESVLDLTPKIKKSVNQLQSSVPLWNEVTDVDSASYNLTKWLISISQSYTSFANSPIDQLILASDSIPKIKLSLDELSSSVNPWSSITNIDSTVNSLREWSEEIRTQYGAFAEGSSLFLSAIPTIESMKSTSDRLADGNSKWGSLPGAAEGVINFKSFTDTLMYVFDPKFNPNIKMNLDHMSVFTKNIQTMASPQNQLNKVAENFDKIQKSMKLTKEHINSFDLKKLTLTDSLMKSIAAMSKNPEAIAAMVGDTMEKSFQELIDALKEIAESQGQQNQGLLDRISVAAGNVLFGEQKPSGGAPGEAPKPPGAVKPVPPTDNNQALIRALSAITLKVNVTNTTAIKVTD